MLSLPTDGRAVNYGLNNTGDGARHEEASDEFSEFSCLCSPGGAPARKRQSWPININMHNLNPLPLIR